jgi:hypothetical protein
MGNSYNLHRPKQRIGKTMSGLLETSQIKSGVIGDTPDTAKAWVQFNASKAIQSSYNVSSVADIGVGNADVNFQSAMANDDYSVNVTYGGSEDAYVAISGIGSVLNGTKFTVWSRYHVDASTLGARNPAFVSCTVFGS